MSMSEWDAWLAGSLSSLRARALFRSLTPVTPSLSAVHASWGDSSPVCLFSLNDYLGLSTHPSVREAYEIAGRRWGAGPRSSALVGGYTVHHAELESGLAALKHAETALLFPTGYAANVSVMAALAGSSREDAASSSLTVLSDELNHASIVDGLRLASRSGATVRVYRHNDMADLERLLREAPAKGRRLVVADALFSMDGDFADLEGLARLKAKHGFLLALDDAHGTLACGESGAGVAEMLGHSAAVDLHLGTLSKAAAACGGFVSCSRAWRDLFVNRGRGQVFSTSLPVPVARAASAALRAAAREPWRRRRLWSLARRLHEGLRRLDEPEGPSLQFEEPADAGPKTGDPAAPAHSYILPCLMGSEQAALRAAEALLREGMHVPAIRPPTVPAGTSRLRISLSAAHAEADVDRLLEALKRVLRGGAATPKL